MIFVANTYSKYATNASGSDSVVVAKWSFLVNDKEIAVEGDATTIDFNLFDTIYDSDGESEETDVAEGFIAPGTSGAFEFALQNTSEVTAQYGIDFEVTNENDIPIEYSLDGENWNTELSDIDFSEHTILNADSNTEIINIQWRWAFNGNNSEDTELGKLATTDTVPEITISATVNAIQVNKRTQYYLDLTENTVALMSHYKPNTNVTLYSGLNLSDITIYAEEDGTLEIGTAKITDVVNARTNGSTYTANMNSYTVTKGNNKIELSLDIAEDETIVFGGNNSVGIAYTSGNEATEANNFSYIDGNSYSNVLNQTNGKNDQLVFGATIGTTKYVELVDGYKASVPDVSTMQTVASSQGAAPWLHTTNLDSYENNTITRIDIAVKKVTAIDDQQYIDVHVIDSSELVTGAKLSYKDTIRLSVPFEQIQDCTAESVDKWISFTGLNIVLGENETIAIGKTGSISIGYKTGMGQSWVGITSNARIEGYEMYYTAYTTKTVSEEEHLQEITSKENKLNLAGKNVSILGDSISTFDGYSNDVTNTNSTLLGNNSWYGASLGAVNDVNETWWMQSINEYNMNLLVNNSASGSLVFSDSNTAGYKTRAVNLHDNIGENSGTNPDMIWIYMGNNDAKNYKDSLDTIGTYEDINFETLIVENDGVYTYETPTTFAEAYAIMIHKIITTYSASDVFTFTLPVRSVNEFGEESTPLVNDIITKIANKYGTTIVDLYTLYPANSDLHPDAYGMDLMTKIVNDAIEDKYLNN